MVLLSGFWPARGLLSGGWPPLGDSDGDDLLSDSCPAADSPAGSFDYGRTPPQRTPKAKPRYLKHFVPESRFLLQSFDCQNSAYFLCLEMWQGQSAGENLACGKISPDVAAAGTACLTEPVKSSGYNCEDIHFDTRASARLIA